MEISAEKFRLARMALGLKQQDFALMVGKSRQTISEYENGKQPVALETYLIALAWGEASEAMTARKSEVGLSEKK